ncbi:MAG: alpha/beta fold hydrolase, partial [Pseudomonadota bacterium]|nr:alpha/beta fold hydrolase [Pseudomonadota bacterium]
MRLAGYNERPNTPPKKVILFVHGDGAMPYDAHGYYQPIWDRLLANGYAIFSWDKPGVGKSTGSWLQQSMYDRQQEVLAAMAFLKSRYGFKSGDFGLMGFSQAGWVVPAVAAQSDDVAFAVGVGFAINWMQQGWYMTERRLRLQGTTEDVIARERKAHEEELDFLLQQPSYDEYLARQCCGTEPMSRSRFEFVVKNFQADAIADLSSVTQPMLLMLGRQDANVDALETQRTVNAELASRANLKVEMFDDATHALLKHSRYRDKQGIGLLMRLLWDGEDAFAPGVLHTMEAWMAELEH